MHLRHYYHEVLLANAPFWQATAVLAAAALALVNRIDFLPAVCAPIPFAIGASLRNGVLAFFVHLTALNVYTLVR